MPINFEEQVGIPPGARVTQVMIYHDIAHPHSGDIEVQVSNASHTWTVRDNQGGATADISETVTEELIFAGDLDAQTWSYRVRDTVSGQTGTLNAVQLYVFYEESPAPDLAPYQPDHWNNVLPIGITPLDADDSHSYEGPFTDYHTLYVNWAVANVGTEAASDYTVRLEVTGQGGGVWEYSSLSTGLGDDWESLAADLAVGPLSPGDHTVKLWIDHANAVEEIDEENNDYERTIAVEAVAGEIHGSVWDDLDADGQWDVGEPGLAGVTVYLDLNQNERLDPGEPSTTTQEDDPRTSGIDETGTHRFTNLAPGDYSVAEVVPNGYEGTFPDYAIGSGELRFVQVLRDGQDGVDGLSRAWSVTVSPDGSHVYVAGRFDDAVAVFSREPTSGELTFVQVLKDGQDGVDGLGQALSVTVSPDGGHVYVTAEGDNAVAVFSRDKLHHLTVAPRQIVDNVNFGNNRPMVMGRHVFYNNTAFDGNDPGFNDVDDQAIATDKAALLPGAIASFDNYTSYGHGINGVMVDLASPAVTPSADDFLFQVGNDSNPADWTPITSPVSVDVREGAGVDSSDRVALVWPDNTIRNTWLQVTVLADRLGMAEDDVFYFGNAVGEAGNSTSNTQVTTTDLLLARNNPRNFLNPAPIKFDFDYNRDQRVNVTDVLPARNNATNFLTALTLLDLSGEEAGLAATDNPATNAVDKLLMAYWP